MKLQGEFVVRQVLDQTVVIPVGKNALTLNGMLLLNDVSQVIWHCLEQGTDTQGILTAVTDAFQVEPEVALEDILEVLQKLKALQLLEE